MRVKDHKKEEALYRATVHVVNDIGFAASSVSKIAKAAQVSPATIYTYFENKDDLIVTTYKAIPETMCYNYFAGVGEELPVKDALNLIWKNIYKYISENKEDYLFTEQFSKSPYMNKVDFEMHRRLFSPMEAVFRRGIEEGILKDAHFHMHALFFYYPILTLANPSNCHSVPLDDVIIEKAFRFAWDSIKK